MYIATSLPQYRAVVTLKHIEEPKVKKAKKEYMFDNGNFLLIAWIVNILLVAATGHLSL